MRAFLTLALGVLAAQPLLSQQPEAQPQVSIEAATSSVIRGREVIRVRDPLTWTTVYRPRLVADSSRPERFVLASDSTRPVPLERVSGIQVRGNAAGTGLRIGAATGAIAGLVTGAVLGSALASWCGPLYSSSCDHPSHTATYGAIGALAGGVAGALAGAGVGALIGAAIPKWKTRLTVRPDGIVELRH